MFFTALTDGKDWGAGASGSPVVSGPYWFLSSKEPSQAKGLPPILVFAVVVADWSRVNQCNTDNTGNLTTLISLRSLHLRLGLICR
jgi:hypothetical protein